MQRRMVIWLAGMAFGLPAFALASIVGMPEVLALLVMFAGTLVGVIVASAFMASRQAEGERPPSPRGRGRGRRGS